jgi:hypothetical protein
MFKTLSKSHIVIYLFLGLVMSSFATGMFERYGIPLFYELVYLPMLYLLRKDFKLLRPIGRLFMPMSIVWLAVLVLSVILGSFSIGGILSVARSYLLLILFVSIGMSIKMDKRFYTILFLISSGSIVGWVLFIQGKLMGIFPWGANELLFAFYGNMLSIPVVISLVFSFFPNVFLIAAVLVVNVYLSFTSGLRRQMLTSIISFVLYYSIYFVRNLAVKTLLPVALVIAGIIVSLPMIEDKVEEVSPYLHHRVFVRSAESGETSGDEIRENHFKMLYNEMENLLLPHGFVSKRTSVDAGVGVFVDMPIYELCYTFGMPVAFVFYIFLIIRVVKLFLNYIRHRTPPLSVWFICGTVFVMLLFLDGSMLSWTYTVPFTGLILGSIIRYGDKRKMKEIYYYKE